MTTEKTPTTPALDLSSVPTPEALEAAANATVQKRIETGRRVADVLAKLRDAYAHAAELEKEFESAYQDATSGAWSPEELTAAGIPTPRSATRARRPRSTARRTTRSTKRTNSSTRSDQPKSN